MTQIVVTKHPAVAKMLKGIVENTLTGVHRLYRSENSQK